MHFSGQSRIRDRKGTQIWHANGPMASAGLLNRYTYALQHADPDGSSLKPVSSLTTAWHLNV